jgi:hypothetical protein
LREGSCREEISCGYIMPKSMGRKEETPYGYTLMPKKHGQERGNTLWVYLNAQKAWAGKRKL